MKMKNFTKEVLLLQTPVEPENSSLAGENHLLQGKSEEKKQEMQEKKDMEELVDRRILLYTSVPVLLVQMYNPAATELHVLFPTGGLLVMFANNFVFF